MTTRRVGFWSASALVVVGIAYAAVVIIGITQAGLDRPIVDPVLAVMESLTLLSAPLLVVLMAAIHSWAAPELKVWTSAALAFAATMAGLTSAVHFIALTAERQTGPFVLRWPSPLYAAELLAWDFFLGLSLVFAAAAFGRNGVQRSAGRALGLTGALCLLGTVGPIIGDLRVQRVGMLGYGVGLPITCVLVARVFREAESRANGGPG